jgi:hypothetical protein
MDPRKELIGPFVYYTVTKTCTVEEQFVSLNATNSPYSWNSWKPLKHDHNVFASLPHECYATDAIWYKSISGHVTGESCV